MVVGKKPPTPVAVTEAVERPPLAPYSAAAPAPAEAARAAAGSSSTRPATGLRPRSTTRGTASSRRQDAGVGSSNWTKYVIGGVILLVIVVASSFSPIMRHLALNKLDACKGDVHRLAEANLAADAVMKRLNYNANEIASVIAEDHGPVEAQIHMAADPNVKSFSSLMMLCAFPLSDAPSAEKATTAGKAKPATAVDPHQRYLTQSQRALALRAASAIYDPETMNDNAFPDDLAANAQDPNLKDALSIAAMGLLGRAPGEDNMDRGISVLMAIALTPDQKPERLKSAISALGGLGAGGNLGAIIPLIGSKIGEQAMACPTVVEDLVKYAGPANLDHLMPLLSSPTASIRMIVLKALTGPNMQMDDQREHALQRQKIATAILPLLDPGTPPAELAAALKAVKSQRLYTTRDAVLALVPKLLDLKLDASISQDFMPDLLGQAFISSNKDASPAPTTPASATTASVEDPRAASEDEITKLGMAVDDAASRTIAAKALARITDSTYVALRPAMEKLIAHGDDADCLAALKEVVAKAFDRADINNTNGNDMEKWKSFLAQDHKNYDRIIEITAWMTSHKDNLQIGDGKHHADLVAAKEYIIQARVDLDAMLSDPAFVAPLGLTKNLIKRLDADIKMKGKDVSAAAFGSGE